MTKKMVLENIVGRLNKGEIIPLSEDHWKGLAAGFPVQEIIPTFLAGEILLVRRPLPGGSQKQAWALVEAPPQTDERVIRPLKNEREARALIADRLAAYERMWDG